MSPLSKAAVEEILSDLDDRSGFSLSDLDDEVLEEIKRSWAKKIEDAYYEYRTR